MTFPAFLITALIVLVFLVALAKGLRHFRGEGGCCGGSVSPPPTQKESRGPAIARRRLHIEGMSCMHCVNHVTQALNALNGVTAQVHLTPPVAVVTLETEVSDETLCKAVTDAGFQVVSVEEMPLA